MKMINIFNLKYWTYFFAYIKGLNYTSAHSYEKAINSFNKALQVCPQDNIKLLGLIYERLGICYADICESDKAKFYLLKSLEIEPNKKKSSGHLSSEIYSRLGFIFKDEGDYKKAKEYLYKALEYKGRIAFTNWGLVERYIKDIELEENKEYN